MSKASLFAPRLVTDIVSSREPELLDQLYALYALAFPLPDEREPRSAFDEILAANEDFAVQRRFGPWREVVAVIREWAGGPVVGGHVFGVTTSPAHRAAGCAASVQGIYTFLHPQVRGRLPMSALRDFMQAQAQATFGGDLDWPLAPPVFIEVNNPLRMSAAEVELDAQSSGVDPHRRYLFWQRSGFRPLAFDYVQPALQPGGRAALYLDLFCSGSGPVPASLLAAHLRPFLAISVLKQRPADSDPDAEAMLAALARNEEVGFVPPERADQVLIRQRAAALPRRLKSEAE